MCSPYAYYLYHVPTGSKYYGIQYNKQSNPNNFWKTYFTSSKKVKDLIKTYGQDSFKYTIRKVFRTKEEALLWETKLLTRINAKDNPTWLNQHNGDKRFRCDGHTEDTKIKIKQKRRLQVISQEHRDKIRKSMTGKKFPNRKRRPQSQETKEKIRNANTGKSHSEITKIKLKIAAQNRETKQSVIDNKNYFLNLPPDSKRPPQGKSKLANLLTSYINPAHKMYDAEFHLELKVKQPHWFRTR